nr:TatD family hydrolase [Propionibacterium australiense]
MTPDEIAAELARLELPPMPAPLPGRCIDNHTHVDSTTARSGLPADLNLAAAAAVGVDRLVHVGCDLADSRWAVRFAADNEQIVAAVAIHPNDAARLAAERGRDELAAQIDQIGELAVAHDRVRAVGETGLDYFRTRDEDGRADQRWAFARHIRIAHETGRALVIHDRDAHADVLSVLDEQGWPERTIMHCFSGDADVARACLDRQATGRDVWLSFGGAVTFKPNGALREALAVTPTDRILVETDAPYLTPVPLRGRPNAPYMVPTTLRFIAAEKGIDVDDDSALAGFCAQITANTLAAYGPWSAGEERDT